MQINELEKSRKGNFSRGSRLEMEKFHQELPEHVKEGLAKGKLHYADTIIYSIKRVDSKTVKMFLPQDDKEVGMRNISNGKLSKNQCLLVSGVWLLACQSNSSSKDDILSSAFTFPENFPTLILSEFSLKANQKCIISETSCMVFRYGVTGYPVGYYKLDNPRLIIDDVPIEFVLELGTVKNLPNNFYVKVGLHGTATIP
jgi:hypothetical protein